MENKTIRITVAGPRGKMGAETLQMISETPHFELVAAIDNKNDGLVISDINGLPDLNAPIYTDIEQCFSNVGTDVLIDFTHPEAGKAHFEAALAYGVRPVIGTSGFTNDDVKGFRSRIEEKGSGGIIAPNFAIGAVLLMKFSQFASKYLPDIEIIEQHHDQKKDAPSGTAVKTAELIQEVRQMKQQGHPDEQETIQGARGAEMNGIRIHSVRLPGLVAHQEVIFGGEGELLTLRHDSMNRKSFMTGVRYAVDTVMTIDTLVYGLENILD
ncbi:dihydrodipicolinate reductase [Scopulibacillus darangshiensis]|uniref:4-hydroxy-tetrahydrodipicolinate reductase n=1 Tax=Scopulibacillus darangshiensis TaxID=442528 RepID=A0A4R2P9A5_9BACL|nr:4-hydroxy-tetrahydrodipicolinate reductase [Scopulibacillus darangshiensis]TCP31620.1 dihydrodipicolinate reductase [Scopulibacillus darangshiensis]